MFTGVIKAAAKIKSFYKKDGALLLKIKKPKGWQIKVGDSIAADGACLTVSKVNRTDYWIELMPETLNRTSFGRTLSTRVNLEQSLRLADRLDGHLVLGHVDCVGKVQNIKVMGSSRIYKISFPVKFADLAVEKGSIAVDGVSLTVVEKGSNWFTVSLVGYTLKHTTLGSKQIGDLVNLEFDIIGKYINAQNRKSKL